MSSRYQVSLHANVKASSPEEAARLAIVKIMNAPIIEAGVDCPDGSFISLGIGDDPSQPAVTTDVQTEASA